MTLAIEEAAAILKQFDDRVLFLLSFVSSIQFTLLIIFSRLAGDFQQWPLMKPRPRQRFRQALTSPSPLFEPAITLKKMKGAAKTV